MNDEDARDDVMGGWLDWEKVWEATLEEVSCTRKKFWKEVWVGTDMGTEEDPGIRCRLVWDFRGSDKDRKDLFAATPLWESKKLLTSYAADRSSGKNRNLIPSVLKTSSQSCPRKWVQRKTSQASSGVGSMDCDHRRSHNANTPK